MYNGFEINLQLGREVLDKAAKVVKVGVTADEIDRVVHEVGVALPAVMICQVLDCVTCPYIYSNYCILKYLNDCSV